jgi:hypothetical protein
VAEIHFPTRNGYWDPALETQSRADWQTYKLEFLQRHLRHAFSGSPFYRSAFGAASVTPDALRTLDDLRHFPFMDKQTLRRRQEAVPPFGDIVAVPEEEIVYISCSSGSTGVATASPFTADDFNEWIEYEARQFWSSGLRSTDRYCHALNFSLFVGGPCGGSPDRRARWSCRRPPTGARTARHSARRCHTPGVENMKLSVVVKIGMQSKLPDAESLGAKARGAIRRPARISRRFQGHRILAARRGPGRAKRAAGCARRAAGSPALRAA